MTVLDELIEGAGRVECPAHRRLREATSDVHQRMHAHTAFAAVAKGSIGRGDYIRLLVRLLGFHSTFEERVSAGPRATRLAADLRALGMTADRIASLPRCPDLQAPARPSQRLGACYVVEGAALGGRVLARGLERLCSADTADGRRFFLGDGAETCGSWRLFRSRLARDLTSPEEIESAAASARATFLTFESWMQRWDGEAQCRAK